MKLHLIMPMGGAGSRFFKDGYMLPKPLIEINGRPFFYWATMSMLKYLDNVDVTFVVLKLHVIQHNIDQVIKEYFPDANIIVIDDILPGPVFTAIEGIKWIEDKLPIMINDCDHMFKCTDINKVIKEDEIEFDGALLTFRSTRPQFSYVKYDANGNVIGTVEKEVVSDRAICGAYLFKNADIYRSVIKEYIDNCPYKECFMSGVYNVMHKNGMILTDYALDYHVEFGTPEEYEEAKKSKYFHELD